MWAGTGEEEHRTYKTYRTYRAGGMGRRWWDGRGPFGKLRASPSTGSLDKLGTASGQAAAESADDKDDDGDRERGCQAEERQANKDRIPFRALDARVVEEEAFLGKETGRAFLFVGLEEELVVGEVVVADLGAGNG